MSLNDLCAGLADGGLVCCWTDESDESVPLSELMLHGWFNDQIECMRLFLADLDSDIAEHWVSSRHHFDLLKARYRDASNDFSGIAKNGVGEHKKKDMLRYSNFAWWATCVFNASERVGSLEKLIESLETVEAAHDSFKPWFIPRGKGNRPRYLNAADAARKLADRGFLRREQRPLLAAGALRGAVITVDGQVVSYVDAEKLYPDETSRRSLESRVAEWATAKCGEDVHMDLVENWLCERVHKTVH